VQGSGWAWLAYDPYTKSLRICETKDQDLLENVTGAKPLLTIDVWEHAYYLDYFNMRKDYAKEIFKVVNWKNVEERLE
jgi:Fe-Mn family superoxide dismutase